MLRVGAEETDVSDGVLQNFEGFFSALRKALHVVRSCIDQLEVIIEQGRNIVRGFNECVDEGRSSSLYSLRSCNIESYEAAPLLLQLIFFL